MNSVMTGGCKAPCTSDLCPCTAAAKLPVLLHALLSPAPVLPLQSSLGNVEFRLSDVLTAANRSLGLKLQGSKKSSTVRETG